MWCFRPEGRGGVLDGTLRRAFGACVSPPPARVRSARFAASPRPPCAAVGEVSSPMRENAADCGISQAAVATWWVAQALLLRAIVREWFVDAVCRLVDFEVVIVVLDSLGPRYRHHAIALGEADHSHTLGGATKA